MKINDVLNCINKVLVQERKAKELPEMLGHFVYYIAWERSIGSIKKFHANIDFINMKYNTRHRVIVYHDTLNCPNDKVEETKEQVSIKALEHFFQALRFGTGKGAYENYVNGEFQGWN